MKRILLLALLSPVAMMALPAEPNRWSATCTDKAGRSSAMSVSVEKESGCKTTVTADAPKQRVDGTALPLSDIGHCTVYRARSGGVEAYRVDPAATIAYVHPEPGLCNAPTPPVTPPPATQYPAPTGFRIVGTTAYCVKPQGARELRMFKVRADGKLGDRVKTFSNCPTSYSFVDGQRYVLKAQYAGDKLSGWSNVATAP
jgi:hypothetical protein